MSEEKIVMGGTKNVNPQGKQEIPAEFIDNEFVVPTDIVDLPSEGVFNGGKKTVTISYLTASADDCLYNADLLRSGKVLDVLLSQNVLDTDLTPDQMIVGDKNHVLLQLRRTGLGDEYQPGKVHCPSCDEDFEPTVDLSKLHPKKLTVQPDSNLEFDFQFPTLKMNCKFRLLTGMDENRLSKITDNSAKKKGVQQKVPGIITERYKLQLMEINSKRDKTYINKVISILPLRDSLALREYIRLISPGVDFENYEYECSNCNHTFTGTVDINYRLFYPNAKI